MSHANHKNIFWCFYNFNLIIYLTISLCKFCYLSLSFLHSGNISFYSPVRITSVLTTSYFPFQTGNHRHLFELYYIIYVFDSAHFSIPSPLELCGAIKIIFDNYFVVSKFSWKVLCVPGCGGSVKRRKIVWLLSFSLTCRMKSYIIIIKHISVLQ